MSEVLLQFDPPVTDEKGVTYVVRICGRVADDGLWEGWIEFVPQDGGTTLRTPRETEQPNRGDLEYWATGITVSYLEGALDRARNPETPDLRPRSVAAQPTYDGPASPNVARPHAAEPHPAGPGAILDPFKVYAQGEDVLRKELGALDEGHLRSIIRAYGLGEVGEAEPAVSGPALAQMIVAAVRSRVG